VTSLDLSHRHDAQRRLLIVRDDGLCVPNDSQRVLAECVHDVSQCERDAADVALFVSVHIVDGQAKVDAAQRMPPSFATRRARLGLVMTNWGVGTMLAAERSRGKAGGPS
jgi:hypothetical protein